MVMNCQASASSGSVTAELYEVRYRPFAGIGCDDIAVNDGRVNSSRSDAHVGDGISIDELLDQAVAAINRGDRISAKALAGEVLAVDRGNADAEDLLTAPSSGGEIRRLTIMFADLVDSTALSTRIEPQTYGLLVGSYRELVVGIVTRFGGYIASTKGDGLLALFGYPAAHEDDVRRAVLTGLEITRALSGLSQEAKRRLGIEVTARVGIHRGVVYLDTDQSDVYGLASHLAAGVSGLAPPGAVVISDAVAPLIRDTFELAECRPAAVKGLKELIPITGWWANARCRPTWTRAPGWVATARLRSCRRVGPTRWPGD
jgi:class 3 adenylate cyclase